MNMNEVNQMNEVNTTTTVESPVAYLKALHACKPAIEFASKFASMSEAWEACERSDWMLWLLRNIPKDLRPTGTNLRLMACWFARNTPLADGRTTWDLLTDARSRTAIEVAERYCADTARKSELQAAHSAAGDASRDAAHAAATASAYAAYATYVATDDVAAYAADAAADAAAYAADAANAADAASADDAADAAAYAADAAADAAAYAAAAPTKARRAQCDHIRSFVANPFAKTL